MTKPLTLAEAPTKLVELECHPGLEHLRRYPPIGVTAHRWGLVEAALGQLWTDLTWLEQVTDPDEKADGLERMTAAYRDAKAFVDAVDAINTAVANGIASALKTFDAAGVPVPKQIVDLLALSATDPLSLTIHDVEHHCVDLAELAALHVNWPEAVAATLMRLDALHDAQRQVEQTRADAEQLVFTDSLPLLTDAESTLRAELDAIDAPDPEAMLGVRHRIEAALKQLQRDEELAQGLVDRHTELVGRLRVYEAKAARLGLMEDSDLSSCRRIAAGLLSHRPSDLRAVTGAVADYQQMLTDKRQKTR